MNFIVRSLVVLAAVATTSCSINHIVQQDYQQYLLNNEGIIEKKTLAQKASYSFSDRTADHRTEFRSGMAGAANLWIVEFGKMLKDTLDSNHYAGAFSHESTTSLHFFFDLESFKYENFQTYLSLKILVQERGTTVIDKTYQVIGNNQAGKVVFGGVFAMKNAIQQSTKFAVDDIMNQLFNDLSAQNIVMSELVLKYG